MKMLVYGLLACILPVLVSCSGTETRFELENVLKPDGIKPLGIQVVQNDLWVSDVDANAIYRLDLNGNRLDSFSGFQRPMHFAVSNEMIYVAEYGADRITQMRFDGHREVVDWPDELDAPSGVDVLNGDMVVADFYQHRIAFISNGEYHPFGSRGEDQGQFAYPTDVRFAQGKIWVADAYNHRIQVFDPHGNWLMSVGESDGINAATGLSLSSKLLAVTDFENDRVLLFDHQGKLKHILIDQIERPTGVFIDDNRVYVANYAAGTIAVFRSVSG